MQNTRQKNNRKETFLYLLWNRVPFSKYPSWCTRRMSPYFDFRWQRKGLCKTSTFNSGSGSFPPQAVASREDKNQLRTVSSMLKRRKIYRKQKRTAGDAVADAIYVAEFVHESRRRSKADWLFSARKPRPPSLPLPGRAEEVALQGLCVPGMKFLQEKKTITFMKLF